MAQGRTARQLRRPGLVAPGKTKGSRPDEDESRVARYTVRAVAQRLGVPTATLRSWSHRYGVGPLAHQSGKHRLYTDGDIAALERMSALIAQGVNPGTAADAAMRALKPPPTQTTELRTAVFDLDGLTAARLIDRHLRHYGVLETWDLLIRPAFADIENQQATGERCTDVEYLLSWTVVSCLQRVPMAAADTPATTILACTEDDRHTLALEALRAALAERDHAALMLGAAVPPAAIVDALQRRSHPICVVLWAQRDRTADVATVKAARAAHARVMVAGPGWDSVRLPARVIQLHSLDDAVERMTAPS